MPSFQRISIMGHLGRDPETIELGGYPKTSFSVAVSERWKDKAGQPQESTEWFSVVAWRQGWLQERLTKGALVYAEGKIKTREYEAKDGERRKVVELIADRVLCLEAPKPATPKPAAAPPSSEPYSATDDDVPF